MLPMGAGSGYIYYVQCMEPLYKVMEPLFKVGEGNFGLYRERCPYPRFVLKRLLWDIFREMVLTSRVVVKRGSTVYPVLELPFVIFFFGGGGHASMCT